MPSRRQMRAADAPGPRGVARGRRRLSAVLLTAAALAVVPIVVETAGATNAPRTTTTPPVTPAPSSPDLPSTVAVIGDSLIFQTSAEQADAISRRGFEPEVYGRPGVPLSDTWVQGYLAAVAGNRSVRTVVIATASNDNLEASSRARAAGTAAAMSELRTRLEAAIDQLAGRCVVLVNVRSTSAAIYAPELAPETNRVIDAVAAVHPGRVVEVDWDAISRPHRADWFVADELHFGDVSTGADRHQAGADAYAEAIAAGVARCAGQAA